MATVPEATQSKPSISQSVTLHFDHMTWGDLKRFVALADLVYVDDSESVDLAWDDEDANDPYAAPIGLTFCSLIGGLG